MEDHKSLTEFLLHQAEQNNVSFHMPGHKGSALYRRYGYGAFLDQIMDCDITEIPGADNLFQPEQVIRSTMNRYRKLYGSRESYLLVNGTSCGLIAGVLATVPAGGKLIMARNCHKSVYNALTLANVEPVYAFPEILPEEGITGEIHVEEIIRCIEQAPDAKAILLPSPNYYGFCSDIASIARIAHEAGMVLIVDQAHGAHLKFFDDLGDGIHFASAEHHKADLVVGSIHKTLGAFTQASVCNVMTGRVNLTELEEALQKMESSSPSYLLMASLDFNADLLEHHQEELIGAWQKNLHWFYEEAANIPGLSLMNHHRLDHSKLNLDMSQLGLDGFRLEEELRKRGIICELVTGNLVMCMTGIGNTEADYQRLLEALKEIAETGTSTSGTKNTTTGFMAWPNEALRMHPIPKQKERLLLGDGAGRICARSIIPYPPGVPLACPGEELTQEVVDFAKALRSRGCNVMGVDQDGTILVGAEENGD